MTTAETLSILWLCSLTRSPHLSVDKAIILAGATTDSETGGSSHKGLSNGKKHARMSEESALVC